MDIYHPAMLTAVARDVSLKNPGPLQQWIRDALQVEANAVNQPYAQSVWVYRCVGIWAGLHRVPLQLLSGARGQGKGKPVETGPLAFLLGQPNPRMDGAAMVEALTISLALKGNFFVLKDPPGSKVPVALYVLQPETVTLERDDYEPLTGRVNVWRVKTRDGGEVQVLPEDMIHCRLPNPYHAVFGMSPLQAARMTVDADYAARLHNRWQMDRHGRLSGVISFKDMVGPDALQTYRNYYHENYEGGKNAGKMAFMDGGATLSQLSMSAKDMDWGEGQRMSREEICAAFGVPPNNAGILDKATYSNFEQSSKDLWTNTLIPLGNKIAGALTGGLVAASGVSGQYIAFGYAETVEALQEAEGTRIERYLKLVKEGKVTPKRAAEMCGIDLGQPHPAHEVVWLGIGEVPFTDATMEPPKEPETSPKPAENAPKQPENGPEKAKEIDSEGLKFELRQARGRSIIRDAGPFERGLNDAMKDFFYAQRRHVLARAEKVREKLPTKAAAGADGVHVKARGAKGIVDELLDGRDWDAELIRRVKPMVFGAASRGARQILQELRRPEATFDQFAIDAFVVGQCELMTVVNETTREALAASFETLFEGIQEGQTVDTVMDGLKGAMRDVFNATEPRRRNIARTETTRALNGGRDTEMRELGVPYKEWLTIRDGDVRESHIRLDGKVVETGAEFAPGLRYPGDPAAPPDETCNCRCTLVPLFKKGDKV